MELREISRSLYSIADTGRMRADSVLLRKQRKRAVMKNGDYNIVQINVSERRRRYLLDLFTTLVDAQWRWTLFVFTMSFVLSWSGFGSLWWLIAFTHGDFEPENLGNETWVPCVSNIHSLTSAFLFSIETQHTIGYGSRYPTEDCPEAVIMVVIQSITGMMIQTLMVGIIFAKMARPKQRTETLLFSRTAVICQRDGQLCLMFRAGDMRDKSHLIATSIRALLVRPRITQEGEILAPFLSELKLSVDQYDPNVFLLWPAVVIHRIDRESPLYTMSAAELLTDKFEIIVTLEGTIESTGQPTQARTSYLPSELLWGHRFEPMIHYSKERLAYEVDYALFHNTYQVDTPLCCAQVLDSLTLDSSTTKPVIY
ncbi:ATP-sensitive inward rectifier potassium channel 12 isoform X2 [Bemisia tabaci]|uniref:ATP-sensitive inward rectifier potassium channel 12 isoform X2 n=1 Tax=Bemisia tabaci TaxID=7038 RepID=UPI0008F986CC|nr:PREDICTED: ATP-sensitive inward rectifier potassium channel 12-like isoform X2 [Bemisia tabaci]